MGTIDKRFDAMDTRFDTMDTRFNTMDIRFDDLEAELSPHGRRLDRLEDKVRQISTKIGLK